MLMRLMRHDGFKHFFHAFVAEIGAADHEKRCDRPGQKIAERQRNRQQDQQLVAKRSRRNLADHRQFAFGGKSDHVTRGDRGIVDHDARRLRPRFRSLARDIVEVSC